jgi:hypothetical protein
LQSSLGLGSPEIHFAVFGRLGGFFVLYSKKIMEKQVFCLFGRISLGVVAIFFLHSPV